MDLKEKIKNLPSSPGVYLMKDSRDSIIYVGKSKNLKNRVSSYFVNSKTHSPKVLKLVKNLRDFDYILTDTEFEAFMLECKLIKEIKPLYNKLMKSPRSYPYIVINMNEEYPGIKIANDPAKGQGMLCWGPYTNKNTLERGIQGIRECCKILCSNNFRKASGCLNHFLGLCIGVCLDETSREQYLQIINKIISLLEGTDKSILQHMEILMNSAVEKLDFEGAAKYRDYIRSVNYMISKARVVEFAEANLNIAIIEYLSKDIFKFFLVKGPRVLFSERYDIKEADLQELIRTMKDKALLYFKDTGAAEIGRNEIDESQIIYSYLKSKGNNCKHIILPQIWIENKDEEKINTSIERITRQ